jgi:DNA-binding response OmpR family regulator
MDPLRVLLVDDEEELVFTIAERLRIRGIEAEAVVRGDQALERVVAAAFDVVLLDLKMPGMGGLEVLRRIKEHRPSLPVILITGHGSTSETPEQLPPGAADYVMKPINLEDLVRRLRAAAGREA